MRLTKQTSHAIRILIDCARQSDRPVKIGEIAARLDITQQNAFKIVHVLTHGGFLIATRGRHGGVRLARPADDIRIGDVVRATEVTHIEVDGEQPASSRRKSKVQPINSLLDSALVAFVAVLDQHTLADMARTSTATAAGRLDIAGDKPASRGRVARRKTAPSAAKALRL